VAAVAFRDGRLWSGASGIAAPGQPATRQTAFELGSITKTYTAAVVLGLVAEGRLSLDDRLDW
jgi:D-alanyl-D-alanine carboxypeptidase